MKIIKIITVFCLLMYSSSCAYSFNRNKVSLGYGYQSVEDNIAYFEPIYILADVAPALLVVLGPWTGMAGAGIAAVNLFYDAMGGYFFKAYDKTEYQAWISQQLQKEELQSKEPNKN
jgi:hypothetical protein